MKTCFKCQRELPLTAFYKHPKMADGHLGKCKDCARADVQANRSANRDYYREYDRMRNGWAHRLEAKRQYAKTEGGMTAHAKAVRKYRERHPQRLAAHNAVNKAVRDGRLVKRACEVCGATEGVEAHHADYSKPLEVIWLCGDHHRAAHGKRPCVPF